MKTLFITLGLLLLSTSCSKDESARGYQLFSEMADSKAYEAYSKNPHSPNGTSMIPPVEGTIARGKKPHLYGNSKEESRRAGRELVNPYKRTKKTLKRGEELYQNYCLICHGPSAEGDGIITRKGFPPPPSLVFGSPLEFSEGRIYHVITAGFGEMASHAVQISAKERWFLAQYIKKLQEDK